MPYLPPPEGPAASRAAAPANAAQVVAAARTAELDSNERLFRAVRAWVAATYGPRALPVRLTITLNDKKKCKLPVPPANIDPSPPSPRRS